MIGARSELPERPVAARAERALAVVALAVLAGSTPWFSGTAVAPDLARQWALTAGQSALLTSSVQLGFIAGTLGYATFNVADAVNPRFVFFASALAGALLNAAFAWISRGLWSAVALRFATGVTLAGIYPVGMKIVATWFQRGLGFRLGVLVGALTLGTAVPYLLRALGTQIGWRTLSSGASLLAVAGGALVLLGVEDGPYLRARSPIRLSMLLRVFEHRPFRLAAFGYFGHMWELYAFWALIGAWLTASSGASQLRVPVAFWAFGALAFGSLGCVAGGVLSRRWGERRVALVAIGVSGICCIISPFAFEFGPLALAAFIAAWGTAVVADSPQFSALAARLAPSEYVGTALTVQNGIGFALTIGSIQLIPMLAATWGWRWAFVPLAAGPALGALALAKLPP